MENHEKKPDRRIIKTKKAIRRALSELMSQKDIDSITVKDIAEAADINRKTFYNYYSGVYQVLEEIENEIIAAFDEDIRNMDYENDIQSPYQVFRRMEQIIGSDLSLSRNIRKSNRYSLTIKLGTVMNAKTKELLMKKGEYDSDRAGLLADYIVFGAIAVYQRWFDSSSGISLEELSQFVWTLAKGCVESMDNERQK